jgi:hypothetical protein
MSKFAFASLCARFSAARAVRVLLPLLVLPTGAAVLYAAGNTATTTTVSVPSSAIAPGVHATLRANVTAGGAPVTAGFVTFLEGSVKLGSAALQPDGTAALSLQFPPGSFQITARFNGSRAGLPSRSQPATLTQQGRTSVVVSSGKNSAGRSILTATVTANEPFAPTGMVSFIDLLTGRILGTANALPGTAQSGLQPGLVPPAVGSYPELVYRHRTLEGDFNGDGLPDYVNYSSSTTGQTQLIVFLGQPGGTYQELPAQPVGFDHFGFAADFNNDGKTDLVVVTSGSTVLLSNGDGTFVQQGTVTGTPVAAGDLNGDGFVDLITNVGNFQTNLSFYQGDGTGNFNAQSTYWNGGVVGPLTDYNNDGNLDLLAYYFSFISGPPLYPSLYPGDGTGDFSHNTNSTGITLTNWPEQMYSSFEPGGIAVDLNGDGNEDIAKYDGTGKIDILLGDGTGHYTSPGDAASIVTGALLGYSAMDVNADGIPDLVAVLSSSLDSSGNPAPAANVLILTGKGDGTFTVNNGSNSTPVTYPLLGANVENNLTPYSDIKGISSAPASATSTATITVPHLLPGIHVVVARYQGNGFLPTSYSFPILAR